MSDSLLEDSSALQAVYTGLPVEVVNVCEQVRKTLRAEVVRQLETVRDALAPYGRFKEWCEANGLNYSMKLTR